MKKLLALLLALTMVASVFVGCGDTDSSNDNDDDKISAESADRDDAQNDNKNPDNNDSDDTDNGNETVNGDGNVDGDGDGNVDGDGDGNVDGDGDGSIDGDDDGNVDGDGDGNVDGDDDGSIDGDGEDTSVSIEGKVVITLIGATFANGKTTAVYDPDTLVSIVAPDRDGETFIAWKDSEGNVLERLNDYDFVATENVTLTAEYVKNTSEGELYIDTDDGKTYYVAGLGSWKGNTLVIPETYNGKPVTKIGISAFASNKDIVNVIIPESIVEISEKAFAFCSNLKNITIPKYCTTIADDAFKLCSSATTLYYNTLQVIENDGYYENIYHADMPRIPAVRKVVLGEGLTYFNVQSEYYESEYNNTPTETQLKCVELPDSIVSVNIGSKYLESINLPNGITNVIIGSERLEELSIPSSVTTLELYCTSLQSLIIPDGVKTLKLRQCSSLKELRVPDSVTNIDAWGLTGLEVVDYQPNINYVDSDIFKNCTSLKKVTLGDNVKNIYPEAFSGCTSLEYIDLTSVAYIGEKAFYGCSSLKTVFLTPYTNRIEEMAFGGCSSLTEVSLPKFIAEMDEPFTGSPVATINYAGTQAEWQNWWWTQNVTGNVTVNFKANSDYDFDTGLRYTSMGDGTCYVDTIPTVSLTTYTIPKLSPSGDKVVMLAPGIFSDKQEMSEITILADLVSIPDNAFYDYDTLTKVNIADVKQWCNISYFGSNPIAYAGNLYIGGELVTHLVIPDGVTKIEANAFYGANFTAVTIPDSVTAIEENAFSVENITDVYISDIEKWCQISFGTNANPLQHANNLYLNGELVTNVVIPDTITEIPAYAFSCSSLTSITIPNSVTTIGDGAFSGCVLLTEIVIPDSVTTMGENVLNGCDGMTRMTIGNIKYLGAPFGIVKSNSYNYHYVEMVLRPGTYHYDSVYYLYLIPSCMTDVVLSENVTDIPQTAFQRFASIKSFSMTNKVTSIGYAAFMDCTALTDIYFDGTVEEWNNIEKNDNWNYGLTFTVHCADGDITIQ